MKRVEASAKITVLIKKLKYIFILVHRCNKRLKYIPSVIFVFLYISSGIDIIPEMLIDIWIAYFDDTIIFVSLLIYFYCNCKGLINEKDLFRDEGKKSLYTHIIRNRSEFDNNIVCIENNCINDDKSCNDNGSFVCTDFNERIDIDKLVNEFQQTGEQADNDKENKPKQSEPVYNRKLQKPKDRERICEEFNTKCRPDSLTIEDEEILW